VPSTKTAHPNSMAPKTPGPTRTAPPMQPSSWKTSVRMKQYSRFGMTGWIYILASLSAIEVVYALGSGPEAYAEMQSLLQNPLVVLFHAFTLFSVGYVLVRFFQLFPKAQPARIGPLKPPPEGVLMAMLYVAWIGITVAMSAVLAGGIF